jgi:hypothetical protein
MNCVQSALITCHPPILCQNSVPGHPDRAHAFRASSPADPPARILRLNIALDAP